METQLSRAEKLDRLFGTPAFAVIIAILCNAMWGSAFPFIKLGYRLFAMTPLTRPPFSALQGCGSC